MAKQYGYLQPSFGYYKPTPERPPSQSLATAAGRPSTASDPWGLGYGPGSSGPGVSTYGLTQPARAPAAPAAQPPAQAPSVNPAAAAAAAAQPQAPGVAAFDPNTDPALQQVYAFTGLSDEQARAGALKAKQQQLLDYGDPNLIRQTIGDETLATAASQNPNSTLANYKTQRDRNITSDTENYNKQNLLYSGARIVGEQQSAQDYQNALGRLAAEQNQGLGAIDSGLAQALSENQRQRNEAMQAAYAQAMQEELLKALLAAFSGGYGGYGGSDGGPGPEPSGNFPAPQVVTGRSPLLPAVQGDQLGRGYRRPGGY